ncbi:MAG: gephyrin-like molybdotransferase Glp [Anaerolineales bacterium]
MLLSVSDARQRLLTAFAPLDTVHAPLTQATGRVLAEALVSRQDYPSFSNSSMDGFALRAEDVQRASTGNPVTLTVVADILAGRPSGVTLQPGETARIMTGAPLPVGADAVVPVEDTDFDLRDPGMAAPKRVKILRAVESGAYVRPKGGDICAGQKVISAGKKLHPQDIGMLAMLGFANVSVYRRPLVGVLSTGDELLPVGAPPEPGKIYESNAHTLSALIEGAGGKTLHLGIAQDRAEAVQERFDRAAEAGVDLIVSSAGVSVGAFDYVRSAVKANGALDFWRVNMRPGGFHLLGCLATRCRRLLGLRCLCARHYVRCLESLAGSASPGGEYYWRMSRRMGGRATCVR